MFSMDTVTMVSAIRGIDKGCTGTQYICITVIASIST